MLRGLIGPFLKQQLTTFNYSGGFTHGCISYEDPDGNWVDDVTSNFEYWESYASSMEDYPTTAEITITYDPNPYTYGDDY